MLKYFALFVVLLLSGCTTYQVEPESIDTYNVCTEKSGDEAIKAVRAGIQTKCQHATELGGPKSVDGQYCQRFYCYRTESEAIQ